MAPHIPVPAEVIFGHAHYPRAVAFEHRGMLGMVGGFRKHAKHGAERQGCSGRAPEEEE